MKKFNFGDINFRYSSYTKSQIVILPVPFDLTSTWIKGAKYGPWAIIKASANMELYDIETDSELYKKGICTLNPVKAKNTKTMIQKVYKSCTKILSDKKFAVTIGGEHSVSIGAIKAHQKKFSNMSLLHLDAHSDRRNIYENNKLSHACVIARAQEIVNKIVSVGIRSMDIGEKKNLSKDTVIFAKDCFKNNLWHRKVLDNLDDKVYVTIDLDVFDSSLMGATGTPEPGGLFWYDVTNLLKKVAREKTVVGFDVVELCPNKYSKSCDFLAAKLIYQFLSYIFQYTRLTH